MRIYPNKLIISLKCHNPNCMWYTWPTKHWSWVTKTRQRVGGSLSWWGLLGFVFTVHAQHIKRESSWASAALKELMKNVKSGVWFLLRKYHFPQHLQVKKRRNHESSCQKTRVYAFYCLKVSTPEIISIDFSLCGSDITQRSALVRFLSSAIGDTTRYPGTDCDGSI